MAVRRSGVVASAAAAVAVVWVVFARVAPSLSLPGCPFLSATGLDCPGCGSTRCVAALSRGDVVAAVDQNVLVPVFLLLFLVAGLRFVVRSAGWGAAGVVPDGGVVSLGLFGRVSGWVSRFGSVAVGVVFVVFFVARNAAVGPLWWLQSGIDL